MKYAQEILEKCPECTAINEDLPQDKVKLHSFFPTQKWRWILAEHEPCGL